MRIRKPIIFILLCLLMICISLAFVGCGEIAPTACVEHTDANGDGICDTDGCGATVEKKPEVEAGVFNENGELFLFKGGVPTFKFILGSDATSQTAQVKELAETIAKYTKDKVEPAVETYSGEAATVEILVGTVENRGDQYKINKYDYGMTGYAIRQIDTKIVITAGSENSIPTALKYFRETVLGIKKNSPQFEDFAMSKDKECNIKQSNYSLKDIKIDGVSVKDYVISYAEADSYAKNAATALQDELYVKCGIHLETLPASRAEGKKISFTTLNNDGVGGGFYVNVDKDKNLVIECEYADKSTSLMLDFFGKNIFNKNGTYDISSDFSYTPNLRDIYYKDFGAVGDGIADDFFALKAAHDEANKYLLNVHADPDATYRIGNLNGSQSITVKSNTYFHGCKFIFDDENVSYTNKAARDTSIFNIASELNTKVYSSSKVPFKSLEAGAKKIEGWEPGVKVLILVENKNVKHYIRSGHNQNSGDNQQEILLVDEKGNIDESTPVQWNYETVTKVTVTYIYADRPIEIVGEEYDKDGNVIGKTEVTTWHNNGPSAYWYYKRNIRITRSNVKISGFKHQFDKYVSPSDGGEGSPYSGFIRVDFAANIVIDNFTFHSPPAYRDSETDPNKRPDGSDPRPSSSMGTYEMGAEHALNVTWSNCDQTDFFYYSGDNIGKVHSNGNMGTNHCRNLVFDNVWNCSFDAHSGLHNATIKNSTLEHINFIGGGLIKYENVTVYAVKKYAVNLREDYGSTWNGDLEIDGLIMKTLKSSKVTSLAIIGAKHTNWYYGYTTYLPQNITIRNLVTAEYSFTVDNGVREEKIETYNTHEVKLFQSLNSPEYNYTADMLGNEKNNNPMIPTKRIDFYTEYTGIYAELGITNKLTFIPPSGTFFKDTEYYIDGVLQ